MSEELKPCPMCGDTSIDYYYEDDNEISVLCRHCSFETKTHRSEKSAARDWNALPRRLRWSRITPTKHGVYWYRGDRSKKSIIAILDSDNGNQFYLHGEWAGPIPEPEEE